MKSDFKQLTLLILNRIVDIRKSLNEGITKDSPEQMEVWFSGNGGETVNRKASFRLVETGGGQKTYIFDDLAR